MSSNQVDTIDYFNRVTGKIETEKIYGEGAVKFFYKSSLGKILSPLIANRLISQLYGFTQDWKFF
jgi:hypothetical protein